MRHTLCRLAGHDAATALDTVQDGRPDPLQTAARLTLTGELVAHTVDDAWLTLILPGCPASSIRDAMFTVIPYRSWTKRNSPKIPAPSGPLGIRTLT